VEDVENVEQSKLLAQLPMYQQRFLDFINEFEEVEVESSSQPIWKARCSTEMTKKLEDYKMFCDRFKVILDEILTKMDASERDCEEYKYFKRLNRVEKFAYMFSGYNAVDSWIMREFETYDELYPDDDKEWSKIHDWIKHRMLLELCNEVLRARNWESEIMGPD
jgi:hypothetical protein